MGADTTYGDLGDKALETIQKIDDRVVVLRSIEGLEDFYRGVDVLDYSTCDTVASVGGAASESVSCTGLLTTDTILGVTQKTRGANNTALTAWDDPAADGAIVPYWTADPGAGAVARVLYRRTDTGASKSFTLSVSSYRPNITFISGYAPTSYVLVLSWELTDEKYIVTANYGS